MKQGLAGQQCAVALAVVVTVVGIHREDPGWKLGLLLNQCRLRKTKKYSGGGRWGEVSLSHFLLILLSRDF